MNPDDKTEQKVVATDILEDVVKKTSADKISVHDLIVAMDAGGFGLVMTLFSLPIIIPLPPPFPSLISIPMVVFAFQLMIGLKSPSLPKRISNYSISRHILASTVEKAAPYIRRAEGFMRPRLLILSSSIFKQVIGFFCFIFSMFILLPMPLSNFLPGMGVLISSFGLLSRDGVIILIGLLIGCIGLTITLSIVFLGVEVFGFAKDWLLQLL